MKRILIALMCACTLSNASWAKDSEGYRDEFGVLKPNPDNPEEVRKYKNYQRKMYGMKGHEQLPYAEGFKALKTIKLSLYEPIMRMMDAEREGDLELARKIFNEEVYAKTHYISGVGFRGYDRLNRFMIRLKGMDNDLEALPVDQRKQAYEKGTFKYKALQSQCIRCHIKYDKDLDW